MERLTTKSKYGDLEYLWYAKDEYIKRDAALIICEKEYKDRLRMCDYCGDTVAWNIGNSIKSLPAEDVAPVVRCRDCTFSGKTVGNVSFCYMHKLLLKPDDFCSYGERRDDNEV